MNIGFQEGARKSVSFKDSFVPTTMYYYPWMDDLYLNKMKIKATSLWGLIVFATCAAIPLQILAGEYLVM